MSTRRRFKFTDDQRRYLKAYGLIDDQVFWLEHALPSIAHEANQGPSNEKVSKELQALHDHFAHAARWFSTADQSNARKVAAATLGLVAHKVDKVAASGADEDSDDAIPARVDARALTNILLAVAKAARDRRPAGTQRPRRASFPVSAVQRIVSALARHLEPARDKEAAESAYPVEVLLTNAPDDTASVVELLAQAQQGGQLLRTHPVGFGELGLTRKSFVGIVQTVMDAVGIKGDAEVAVRRYVEQERKAIR